MVSIPHGYNVQSSCVYIFAVPSEGALSTPPPDIVISRQIVSGTPPQLLLASLPSALE